ncbi:MAG: helicase-associated domain-containing protein [Chloroflexi bacterium]|nr:helicase-associated domain-containing protein [Chloroflexota bacterium]
MELAPQGFTRSLQALPDDDLSVLLMRRPQATAVARAAQPAWADLATALLRPRDVALTLSRLDRFLGQVVELAALAEGRLTPEIADAEGLARSHLDEAARELKRWGLATTDQHGALLLAPGAASMVWDPGGLGRPAAELLENLNVEELRQIAMVHGLGGAALPKLKRDLTQALHARLTDPDRIRAIVRAAPPAARAALEALRQAGGSTDHGSGAGPAWARSYMSWSWHPQWVRPGEHDGASWLTTHGIVLPEHEQRTSVAVPSEIERALRGRVFARWDVRPPALEVAPLGDERHPVDLISAMDTLLEEWRHAPPPALKDGGVPKREIKRAARRVGQSEDDTRLLILLAGEAGLLRERELVPERRNRSRRHPRVLESRRAVVEPSGEAERWLGLAEPERWLELARVWLRASGMDGDASAAGPSRERVVVELLAEIPDGRGASASSIGAALSWRYPAFFSDPARAMTTARSVGVGLALLGAGSPDPIVGLNTIGRLALRSGGGVDAETLRRAFPAPADRCVVTADHRVVVSGPPGGELARMLRRVAEVVSVRPARVYRLTEASLGRALDGGVTASSILEVLRRHVSEPVPSNVVALVEDAARRHGRLRVGSADAYVVADDPAQLELVARDRALGGGLRRVAPTVAVIEGRDRDEVVAALRRAGLMPVLDGAVPVAPATAPAPPRRASRPQAQRPATMEPAALDDAEAARIVAALRAAPAGAVRAAPTRPAEATVRDMLGQAARTRRPLEIGYRGASGALEVMTAAPYHLQQDQVFVQDGSGFGVFALDLRRILWAQAAPAANGQDRPPGDGDLYLDGDDDEDDADLLIELEAMDPPRRRRR